MKKKLSHVIFATILAFCTIIPMFPRSASADTNSVNNRIVIFNNRLGLFAQTALNANDLLGTDQVLFLTSAMFGVSLQDLRTEFAALNLSIDKFIVAELMAHAGNVPVEFVTNQLQLGRSFGQISLMINSPFRLLLFNLNNFDTVLNNQILIATGQVSSDQTAAFNATIDNLTNIFNVFSTSVGTNAFTVLLAHRLALETGFTLPQIRTAFTQLIAAGNNPGQITLALLGFNTVLAVQQPTPFINGSLEQMIAPLVIREALAGQINQAGVPFNLFIGRVVFFQRVVSTSMNG